MTKEKTPPHSKKITRNGVTKSLGEWCKEEKMSYKHVYYRLSRLKWDVEKSLTQPIRKARHVAEKD